MEESRRSPVEVGSVSRYLQDFIHPGWCRISSINSSPSVFNYTSICFLATSLWVLPEKPLFWFGNKDQFQSVLRQFQYAVWWICNLIRPNQLRLLLDAGETHHDRHQKWGDKREVSWFFTYINQQNCLKFFGGKHINVKVVLPYGSKIASKASIHQRKHQWLHNGQLHPTSQN